MSLFTRGSGGTGCLSLCVCSVLTKRPLCMGVPKHICVLCLCGGAKVSLGGGAKVYVSGNA